MLRDTEERKELSTSTEVEGETAEEKWYDVHRESLPGNPLIM